MLEHGWCVVLKGVTCVLFGALAASVTLSVLLGCGSVRKNYERDVLTEGAVIPAGPPASSGERAEEGEVVLAGGAEIAFTPRSSSDSLKEGTGNVLVLNQARGYLGFGVSPRVELGASARYAGGTWGRESIAADAEENVVTQAVHGYGMTVRVGLTPPDAPDFKLNFDGELEVLNLPYHRRISGKVTTEYCPNANPEECGWGEPMTATLEPRVVDRHKIATIQKLGLSSSLRVKGAPLVLLFGAHYQHLPQVKGYRKVYTQCVNGDCDGPTSEDDIPVHEYVSTLTVMFGTQLEMSEWMALVGLVHGSPFLDDAGQDAFGASLQLQIRP